MGFHFRRFCPYMGESGSIKTRILILGRDRDKGYVGPNRVKKFFLSFHLRISI